MTVKVLINALSLTRSAVARAFSWGVGNPQSLRIFRRAFSASCLVLKRFDSCVNSPLPASWPRPQWPTENGYLVYAWQQEGPQQAAALAGFFARTNALMNLSCTFGAIDSSSMPAARRNSRASSIL